LEAWFVGSCVLLDAAPSGADCVYIARSYKDSAPTERSSSPLNQARRLTIFNRRGNSKSAVPRRRALPVRRSFGNAGRRRKSGDRKWWQGLRAATRPNNADL